TRAREQWCAAGRNGSRGFKGWLVVAEVVTVLLKVAAAVICTVVHLWAQNKMAAWK
ncbi:hypothetical protein OOU_Y34scaffold00215g1, partial [Pyricularia oryzae Y34]